MTIDNTASVRALATTLWKVMGKAAKLPTNTKAVLDTRLSDSTVRWALALMLACWRLSQRDEPEAAGARQIMLDAGGRDLLDKMILPDKFLGLLKTARSATAEHEIAGLAVVFEAAINDLPEFIQKALLDWLRTPQFMEVGRALIQRLPEPGSARPPVWGSPPSDARQSRVTRFDRADFAPRSNARAARLNSTTTPVLEDEEVVRGQLALLGWDGNAIDHALKGPRRG